MSLEESVPRRPLGWWPQHKADRLVEMWKEGASALQIAKEIQMSRSAVLGWASRHRDLCPMRAMGIDYTPQGMARSLTGRVASKRKALEAAAQSAERAGPSEGVPLLELRSRDCRWPMGEIDDPPRLFCGAPQEDGSSYCPVHRRLNRSEFQPRTLRMPGDKPSALVQNDRLPPAEGE